jgi:hypothetical protein
LAGPNTALVKSQHSGNIMAFLRGLLDFALEKCEHFNLLGHLLTQT